MDMHNAAKRLEAAITSGDAEERERLLQPFSDELQKALDVLSVGVPARPAGGEPSDSATLKSDIGDVPPERLSNLVEAIELSDMEMIEQEIIEIRSHHVSLGDTLARLATNFQYDEMLALIQEMKQ